MWHVGLWFIKREERSTPLLPSTAISPFSPPILTVRIAILASRIADLGHRIALTNNADFDTDFPVFPTDLDGQNRDLGLQNRRSWLSETQAMHTPSCYVSSDARKVQAHFWANTALNLAAGREKKHS